MDYPRGYVLVRTGAPHPAEKIRCWGELGWWSSRGTGKRSQANGGWKLVRFGTPLRIGWNRNGDHGRSHRRKKPAMAGRAAVRVGTGMGMVMTILKDWILDQNKAGQQSDEK